IRDRCIVAVEQAFENAGLKPLDVRLGEVNLPKAPNKSQLDKIGFKMLELGFEILDDQKQRIIEKVKNLLIQKIQTGELEEHFRISDYLSKKLNKDYSAISRLFSEVEGMTVEQYFILQKIEKVKELLVYGELNLNEISYNLGYSSAAHLSAQFKKITGLTPGHLKKLGALHRHPLDKVKRK
ncbi:MAG: AraC family transcriptional regulator, partial [Chitinophagaceae bacterium]